MKSSVVTVDTSAIDLVDLSGMVFHLKQAGIIDGQHYQIDNSLDLLMDYTAYLKCKNILSEFGAEVFSTKNTW